MNPIMQMKSVTLAQKYDPAKHNVNGWVVSEKLDGVRAIWDGQNFISRSFKYFCTPHQLGRQLREHFSGVKLDGELYIGRGCFNKCSGIVRQTRGAWIKNNVTFQVFDMVSNQPWRERFAHAKIAIQSAKFPFVQFVKHEYLESSSEVEYRLKQIVAKGGEGLMLRNPEMLYEEKRSRNLLKVKLSHHLRATIVGYSPGLGKHIGKLGAYDCLTEDGAPFSVGSGLTDLDREEENRLPIGTMITVRYFELFENGRPRFPTFVKNEKQAIQDLGML